jgi:hypothetical protein
MACLYAWMAADCLAKAQGREEQSPDNVPALNLVTS